MKKHIDKNKKKLILGTIPTILFLTFTSLVFGPLQILLLNSSDVWFSIWKIVPILLVICAVSTVILIIPSIFLKEKSLLYTCLIFGLAFALYIQGNFIPTWYGVLDGSEIDWDSFGNEAIINSIIWIICIIVPLVGLKLKKELVSFFIPLISGGIVLVQLVTLTTLFLVTDLDTNSFYLSTDGLYEVSEENVVIFVLDTFDASYLDLIEEDDPTYLEPLDGFTSYENAISLYSYTIGSVPHMLTGQIYLNEIPYSQHIDEAYWETDYYKYLSSEGYDIGIYTFDSFLSEEFAYEYVSNACFEDETKISSPTELIQRILNITAASYFPHVLKEYIWPTDYSFDEFQEATEENPDVFSINNSVFYTQLIEQGLEFKDVDKSYKFIHLYGVHPPYIYSEDMTEATTYRSATVLSQAKASLYMVYEYIEELKDLGIYDNTMIIVTADHGYGDLRATPIFLVKGFNQSGELEYSDNPISTEDIHNTVLYEVNEELSVSYGIPVQSSDAYTDRERVYYFYFYSASMGQYLPTIKEYTVTSELELYYTGVQYLAGNNIVEEDFSYQLGATTYFSKTDSSAIGFFTQAFGSSEDAGTWSIGESSMLQVVIEESDKDIYFEFDVNTNGEQYVQVEVIYDEEYYEVYGEHVDGGKISFIVPSEYIEDGNITLGFSYPNATQPSTSDPRVLAVFYKSMLITDYSTLFTYGMGATTSFTQADSSASRYFVDGISSTEETGTWSLGDTSEMLVNIEEQDEDIYFEFDVDTYGEQYVQIEAVCDDEYYEVYGTYPEEGKIAFVVPADYIIDGYISLKFSYPNATQPDNGDTRVLSVFYKNMLITEN